MKKIILVVLILSITLSSCSIQKEENKPLTIGEIDRFFTENFDDFQKIVQLYYDNPQFYEWYFLEFDRHGLNNWTIKNIDPIKRRCYFSDDEWAIFEKMFISYHIVEITMYGAEHGLQFIWTLPDQDSEVISIGYYYDVGEENDKHRLMNYHIIEETTYENWIRFKSK